MAYHATHINGAMDAPDLDKLGSLLDELQSADNEHNEVSLSHDSGWTLSVSSGGRLILENIEEDGTARHVTGLQPLAADRDLILRMWNSLAQGDEKSVLDATPWQPGYR